METPSGKWAEDENFPVGSRLIARPLRPHVVRYYAFARAIDDIADNPSLTPDDKVARLDAFDRALFDPRAGGPDLGKAKALRESLRDRDLPLDHARDLVVAFKQDATKGRYDDWDELLTYCRYSAEPVGRFLLDLHGEDRALWPYSDALCTALQIINHLQDCATDYRTLDRVYLPQNWLQAEGETVHALDNAQSTPGLRRVLDRCLAGTEELLTPASALAARLRSPRLAAESAAIANLARVLTDELYRRDPLAERVALGKARKAFVGLTGTFGVMLRRWRGPVAAPSAPVKAAAP